MKGLGVAGQTHLFFHNSADTIQVPLTHHTEGSHLSPQQHHIILKPDESVTKRSQMTVSTQVWPCMCVLYLTGTALRDLSQVPEYDIVSTLECMSHDL